MENLEKYLENLKKTKKESKHMIYPLISKKHKEQFTKEKLKKLFLVYFEIISDNKFIVNDVSDQYLELLLNYFFKNDEFYTSSILNNDFNNPNLNKGLLIVGNTGVGKSILLKTFERMFKDEFDFNPSYHFNMYHANELKTTFEALETNFLKTDFLKKHKTAFKCYDDVKSEIITLGYDKREIMKDILYMRYDRKERTIITCNYDKNYPGDLIKALEEFGTTYDGRIYDRLFEMFNIIEIDGKSLRM